VGFGTLQSFSQILALPLVGHITRCIRLATLARKSSPICRRVGCYSGHISVNLGRNFQFLASRLNSRFSPRTCPLDKKQILVQDCYKKCSSQLTLIYNRFPVKNHGNLLLIIILEPGVTPRRTLTNSVTLRVQL